MPPSLLLHSTLRGTMMCLDMARQETSPLFDPHVISRSDRVASWAALRPTQGIPAWLSENMKERQSLSVVYGPFNGTAVYLISSTLPVT